MAQKTSEKKKPISADWFVQGVLTRIGDTFDRLTGRGWKPSSSLATSELAEKLKALVDAEVRETPEKRRFVPHNIKLKMQWDKFSTDSETALKKLEAELLTSLVDHINDRRYYTYAPISLEVKPDYFTNGVKLFAGFDKADEDEREVSLNVTVPSLTVDLPREEIDPPAVQGLTIAVRSEIAGKPFEKIMDMAPGGRLSVGRTKENDISLDDPSVSKMHASIVLNNSGELAVADTGSTNGTFVDGERISYGKAIPFSAGRHLRFGTVELAVEIVAMKVPDEAERIEQKSDENRSDTYKVGEFEFTSKIDESAPKADQPAPTVPSIPMPTEILKPAVNGTTESRDNAVERSEPEK